MERYAVRLKDERWKDVENPSHEWVCLNKNFIFVYGSIEDRFVFTSLEDAESECGTCDEIVQVDDEPLIKDPQVHL